MAIRNFRKNMKPVIWVVVVLMTISGLGFILTTVGNGNSSGGFYGFKLNGKKIPAIDIERTIQIVGEQYALQGIRNVPGNAIEILAFNEVINKALTLNMADNAKIRVTTREVSERAKLEEEQRKIGILASMGISSDVNSINNMTKENISQPFREWAIQSIKKSIDEWTDEEVATHYGTYVKASGDELYKNWMISRGYTRNILREEIKNNLKMEKFFIRLSEQAKEPTDEEIENFYESNRAVRYSNTTLEEERNNIIEMLKQEEAVIAFYALLDDAKKAASIEDISERYDGYQEIVVIEGDDISVTNLDMAKLKLSLLPYLGGDISNIEELANELMDKQLQMVKVAKERGIIVNESVPLDRQFIEYQELLSQAIRKELNPTEEELREFFQNNRSAYDIEATLDMNIAVMQFEYSQEDFDATRMDAEKLLSEVTVENFRELATEHSQDGTAIFGGELGEFSREDMVPEFSEAVFSGEVGEIYPELVTTDFGQHIIWIEERDDNNNRARASHILLMTRFSDNSINRIEEKSADIVAKLTSGEMTFENLQSLDPEVIYSNTVRNVTAEGYMEGLGRSRELTDIIFASEMNDITYKILGIGSYIFQKIGEVMAEEALYEDFEDIVREDYLNRTTMEEMQKLF